MRLINADAIKIPYKRDDIYYRNTYSSGVTAMVHAIGKTPTIEAEPVVHGRWILKDDHGSGVCSNCHRQDKIDPLAGFCRYCGARMDGGDQNE